MTTGELRLMTITSLCATGAAAYSNQCPPSMCVCIYSTCHKKVNKDKPKVE